MRLIIDSKTLLNTPPTNVQVNSAETRAFAYDECVVERVTLQVTGGEIGREKTKFDSSNTCRRRRMLKSEFIMYTRGGGRTMEINKSTPTDRRVASIEAKFFHAFFPVGKIHHTIRARLAG